MKKIILVLGCSWLLSSVCLAGGPRYIGLSRTESDVWQKSHKAPTVPPRVGYDEQSLYMEAPCAIEEATITIRDAEGNIVYNVCTSLPDSSYVIPLPADVCADRYSIELDYNGFSFIGYFD